MALLSRDEILSADDLTIETIAVPEWGGDVAVRTLTGAEKDKWEAARQNTDGSANLANVRGSIVALCCCDMGGKSLFTSRDIVALGKKSARALDRVLEAVKTLNGVTEDDLEELEKN